MVHPDLSGELLKDKIVFTEWIIESPELFAGYLQELYGQCARCEGKFGFIARDKRIGYF